MAISKHFTRDQIIWITFGVISYTDYILKIKTGYLNFLVAHIWNTGRQIIGCYLQDSFLISKNDCSFRPRLFMLTSKDSNFMCRSPPTITYDDNDVPVMSNVYIHAQTLNERMICYERQLPSLVCEDCVVFFL